MNEDSVEQRALNTYDKATVLWQDMLEKLQTNCQDAEFLSRFPIHDSDPPPPDFIEYGTSFSKMRCKYAPPYFLLYEYPLSLPSYITPSPIHRRVDSRSQRLYSPFYHQT